MKNEKPKLKRYVVTLNECEMRRLSLYAAQSGVDRPTALGRIVRRGLRDVVAGTRADDVDDNQLRLFDSVQIDIFNNTAKVNTKEE